jgi:hypothetical protein
LDCGFVISLNVILIIPLQKSFICGMYVLIVSSLLLEITMLTMISDFNDLQSTISMLIPFLGQGNKTLQLKKNINNIEILMVIEL